MNNKWSTTILTLYPEMFPGILGQSLAGKGLENNIWNLQTINIRDFGIGKHKKVDDKPAGGGPGMVIKSDVLANAIDSINDIHDNTPIIYPSPKGKQINQDFIKELAQKNQVIFLCGRFEGIDERILIKKNIIEVSIGDFILSGGEIVAIAIIDAVVRLFPGIMGDKKSAETESFTNNLLEYPQYTLPRVWEGLNIPEVLLSGNHKKINKWRQNKSEEITKYRRPDLWSKYIKK